MKLDPPLWIGPEADPDRFLLLEQRELADGRLEFSGHDVRKGVPVAGTVHPLAEPPGPPPPIPTCQLPGLARQTLKLAGRAGYGAGPGARTQGDAAAEVSPGRVQLIDRFDTGILRSERSDSHSVAAATHTYFVYESVAGPTIGQWRDRHPERTSSECESIIANLAAALAQHPHGTVSADCVVLSTRGFLLRYPDGFVEAHGPSDLARRDADRTALEQIRTDLLDGATSSTVGPTGVRAHRARRALAFSVIAAMFLVVSGNVSPSNAMPSGKQVVEIVEPTGDIGLSDSIANTD